jgi:hypothetical protein
LEFVPLEFKEGIDLQKMQGLLDHPGSVAFVAHKQ